ncbi:hypothetical protein CHI43_24680 [Salmonella enterica subsp. enterica serovar Rubislaw]|nr:hypothetical protein [Salmonella enterica subsp. enterica serovar Rubislaw]
MSTTQLTNCPKWESNMFHLNKKPCNLLLDCTLPMAFCLVRFGTIDQNATFIMLKKASGGFFISDEYISFLTAAYYQFKPTEVDKRKVEAEIKSAIGEGIITRTAGGYMLSTIAADNINKDLLSRCNQDVPGYKMVNGLLTELFEKANRNAYR